MSSKYWDVPMNFIGGCTPCSPGCLNCWAADCASKRLANHPLYKGLTKNGKWTGEVRVMPELIKVIGDKPKTIFWCNMSDMFHPKVDFEHIDIAFAAMAVMKQHAHLVLTKRIGRMAEYIRECNSCKRPLGKLAGCVVRLPFPNVHLGVTICNQKEADEKIPILLQIPAAHRWLSIEPMLGEIDLDYETMYSFIGEASPDWVVVGCESGSHRRLCELEWVRSIVQQCKAAGVDWLVKQIPLWGVNWNNQLFETSAAVKLHLGECEPKLKVCHDISKFPADLQVRETI